MTTSRPTDTVNEELKVELSPHTRFVAIALPLVVVLLVFLGLVDQWSRLMWDHLRHHYLVSGERLAQDALPDLERLFSDQIDTQTSERMMQFSREVLLSENDLLNMSIIQQNKSEYKLWVLPPSSAPAHAASRVLHSDLSWDEQLEMPVSEVSSPTIAPKTPRSFWFKHLVVVLPVVPSEANVVRYWIVLEVFPRKAFNVMASVIALGLVIYLLMGLMLSLNFRNITIRHAATHQAEQHTADLGWLREMSYALSMSSQGSGYDYLSMIKSIREGTDSELAGIYLPSEEGNAKIELRHAVGFNEEQLRLAPEDPIGERWLRELLKKEEPVRLYDLREDRFSSDSFLAAENYKGFTWIPIRGGMGVQGGIFFANQTRRYLSRHDCGIIDVLGTEVLMSSHHEETRRGERVLNERLQSVAQLNEAICANLGLEEVLRMVMREAMNTCEAEKGFILIPGETPQQFRAFESTGLNPASIVQLREEKIPELTDPVLRRERSMLVHQPHGIGLPRDFIHREGLHTMLAVPIISYREKAIGMLVLLNRKFGLFTANDQALVELLAHQAAIAYDQSTILEVLKEQTRLYETLLEHAHDLIFFLNDHGQVTYVNQAWAVDLGHEEKNVVGEDFTIIAHPKDRNNFSTQLAQALKGKPVQALDFRVRDREGRWHFLEANLSPIYGHSSLTRGVFGIARDITEARLTDLRQRRLLGSRQVMADLKYGQPLPDILNRVVAEVGKLFGVDWGVILLDEEEDENERGHGWQVPENAYLPGRTLSGPIRRFMYHKVLTDDFCFGGDLYKEFAESNEIESVAPHGEKPRKVSYEGVAIRETGGEAHGILLLVHESEDFFHGWDELPLRNLARELGNLTAQKQLEKHILVQNRELAQKTRRAEEAARLKSRFLAAISHELRTPLHAIIGFTEVVLEKTPELPPRRIRNLDAVLRNARMLLNLIEDLLDLSRIEAGKIQVHQETIRVADLIEDVALSLRSLSEDKSLSLETQIEDPELQVLSDRSKVRQILINLTSNAIKFTEKGGVVLRAERLGQMVQLSVVDTGVGIASEDLGVIFQEFEQVGKQNNTGGMRGSGLGLALSQKLAAVLGGQILVQTMAGEGSTFTLELPEKYEYADRIDDDHPKDVPLFEPQAPSDEMPIRVNRDTDS